MADPIIGPKIHAIQNHPHSGSAAGFPAYILWFHMLLNPTEIAIAGLIKLDVVW